MAGGGRGAPRGRLAAGGVRRLVSLFLVLPVALVSSLLALGLLDNPRIYEHSNAGTVGVYLLFGLAVASSWATAPGGSRCAGLGSGRV